VVARRRRLRVPGDCSRCAGRRAGLWRVRCRLMVQVCRRTHNADLLDKRLIAKLCSDNWASHQISQTGPLECVTAAPDRPRGPDIPAQSEMSWPWVTQGKSW